MRIRGEMCSAQSPSRGYFWETGANGRYREAVCTWNGETVADTSGADDWNADLSDLCFFDLGLCPSSPWSRFRFFSPCEDLCFFSDFDLCFSEPIVGVGDFAAFSIDISELWLW